MEYPFGNIHELANRYGTPLLVYSESILLQNAARLKDALPNISSLAYSIKANPNPTILWILADCGLLAEASSLGELSLALRTGIPPEKLFLGGPSKTTEAITTAINAGISAILVESATDLARVKSIAGTSESTVNVLLRVNPSCLSSGAVLKMGGIASQFGIDEEQLPEIIQECDEKSVRYAGLFLYAGSQHFSAEEIVDNTSYLCRLCQRLCAMGLPAPTIIDFGGGFGVPEDESQPELDLSQLKKGMERIFNQEVKELTNLGLQQTIFESGRYLVSRAGIYVASVVDVKRSRGKQFAILDGGINNLGIRQLMYRTFEPQLEVWKQSGQKVELTTFVGPTCTPIDIVHKGIEVSDIKVGDLVVIHNFGAYSISYSPVHFCGHPWPAEVLVRADGSYRLVRRRGELEESCGLGYINPLELTK